MPSIKVTVPAIRERKQRGPKLTAVTAYDATIARLLDDGGADILLVGDSLGMVVQGQPSTLAVTVEEMAYHARAVARGTERAHIVVDMPFMSFQVSSEKALEAAGRLVKEGNAEAVKLEGGVDIAETVKRIVAAGIPVMGHVGLTPQSVHAFGGFRVQGKTEDAAARVLQDAKALEQAGAYAVVLEAMPADLARRITETLDVPTIGIGAGPHCDGQVLVCYDLLGMYREIKPKFVKQYAELGDAVVNAMKTYVSEVQSGSFPEARHSFGMAQPKSLGEPTGAKAVVSGNVPQYGPADEK
ncbi:MAG TPA: 3-methyl-2-oxobutanoate hydroxymethyltransferase [Polyangiaceae bacterium]|jgi:3-methyl-2-oxobutanoate hydroxymethyltransferase|nr:3-methyl-2-oxobutanoate hydroxymethyltransferase [Polyangiaceae bacterium]